MRHARNILPIATIALLVCSNSTLAQGETDPDLQACAHIFDPVGIPAGTDGADDRSYVFANGSTSAAEEAPYMSRCHLGGFALRLNGVTKVPDWVAEDITADESGGGAERSDKFFVDPTLPPGFSAQLADYKSSGFDRGHQAPAGNFSAEQALMNETFVLSNMGPQVGRCFNQGIWRDLEMAVRALIATRERLIVFTGPIFEGPLRTIEDIKQERARDKARQNGQPPSSTAHTDNRSATGQSQSVAVPDAFFKIVYDPAGKRVMAFRFKNEARCKTSYAEAEFRTTIDMIEEETGYDFLSALPHREQKLLEKQETPFWNW